MSGRRWCCVTSIAEASANLNIGKARARCAFRGYWIGAICLFSLHYSVYSISGRLFDIKTKYCRKEPLNSKQLTNQPILCYFCPPEGIFFFVSRQNSWLNGAYSIVLEANDIKMNYMFPLRVRRCIWTKCIRLM